MLVFSGKNGHSSNAFIELSQLSRARRAYSFQGRCIIFITHLAEGDTALPRYTACDTSTPRVDLARGSVE